MTGKINIILYSILLMSLSVNSQTNREFVVDFSNCEFPIYFEGSIELIKFSKNKDTIEIVNLEHSLLLEKINDTLVISEYHKGKYIERTSEHKFTIDENLIFDNKNDYWGFPEIVKLLFMKKEFNSNRLHLPTREYRGNKDDGAPFEVIDSLFIYQMISARGVKRFPELNLFKVFDVPKFDIKLYCFKLVQSSESERYPNIPDGIRLSKEIMSNSKYLESSSTSYNYVLIKNTESRIFNGIVGEEHRITSSQHRYEETKSKGIYVMKQVDDKILKKIKN